MNIVEDGRISTISNDLETDVASVRNESEDQNEKSEDRISDTKNDDNDDVKVEETGNKTTELASTGACDDNDDANDNDNDGDGDSGGGGNGIKKCLNQLTRCYRNKMWLLAYLAIGSSWPLLRLAYRLILKNKFRSINSGTRKRI